MGYLEIMKEIEAELEAEGFGDADLYDEEEEVLEEEDFDFFDLDED